MAAPVNDTLIPMEPTPETLPEVEERAPVAKTFRPYDPHQILLLPPSLDEWLPEGHLARFVSELVEEALDLSAIRAAYVEERGYPPYDPRLMVKLLIYGYCTGQRSSRGIEKRCHDDVAFRYLRRGRRRTTARSRASDVGIWRHWRACSCRGCASARRRGWCGWERWRWTGPSCGRTRAGTRR